MYGLEEGFDLSFLVGGEMTQVCVGQFQQILRFDKGIVITVESHFTCQSEGGELYSGAGSSARSAVPLLALLGAKIVATKIHRLGDLEIRFSNRTVLVLQDSNKDTESYQISGGPSEIVV